MFVTDSLSVSIDFTNVTLVSEDTYGDEEDEEDEEDEDKNYLIPCDKLFLVIKV